MMSEVDPVAVAKRIVAEATSFPFLWDSTSEKEKVALCRVVLAAAERVKGGHSIECPWANYADGRGHHCRCGHDAFAAALRGKP